ncbi:hypothetical protein D3C72_2156520 [compost metagenome]
MGRIVWRVEHLRLVLRHIDLFRIGRLNDDVVVLLNDLHLVVGLEHAGSDRLVAKLLNGDQHILLLVGHCIGKGLRPIDILAHHLDDIGIVQK